MSHSALTDHPVLPTPPPLPWSLLLHSWGPAQGSLLGDPVCSPPHDPLSAEGRGAQHKPTWHTWAESTQQGLVGSQLQKASPTQGPEEGSTGEHLSGLEILNRASHDENWDFESQRIPTKWDTQFTESPSYMWKCLSGEILRTWNKTENALGLWLFRFDRVISSWNPTDRFVYSSLNNVPRSSDLLFASTPYKSWGRTMSCKMQQKHWAHSLLKVTRLSWQRYSLATYSQASPNQSPAIMLQTGWTDIHYWGHVAKQPPNTGSYVQSNFTLKITQTDFPPWTSKTA